MKKPLLLFTVLLLSSLFGGVAWADDYTLTQTTAVESGSIYMFETSNQVPAFINQFLCDNSAANPGAAAKTGTVADDKKLMWKVTAVDGETNGYTLQNLATGKFLCIRKSAPNGTKPTLIPTAHTNYIRVFNEADKIVNLYCGASMLDGANSGSAITTWQGNGSSSQRQQMWKVEATEDIELPLAVRYHIYDNANRTAELATLTVGEFSGQAPRLASALPEGTTVVSGLPETITSETELTVYVTSSVALPFVITTDTSNPVYYLMMIRGTKYIRAAAGDNNPQLTTTAPTSAGYQDYEWYITGNYITGYQFHSRTGKSIASPNTNNGQMATMVASDPTNYTLEKNGANFLFSANGSYLSDYGGGGNAQLKHYTTKADAGNYITFFTPVIDGCAYTIASYVSSANSTRYLQSTGSAVALITASEFEDVAKNKWIAHATGTANQFTFENVADGLILDYAAPGVSAEGKPFTLSQGTSALYVAMWNSAMGGGRYVAASADGTKFAATNTNYWSTNKQQNSGGWSTDFIFQETTVEDEPSAEETIQITVDMNNGSWTQGGSSYWKQWTSTSSEPQVTLTIGANNMNVYAAPNIQLFGKTNANASQADYELACSSGYRIQSVSLDFTSSAAVSVGVSVNGSDAVTSTSTTDTQSVLVEGIDASTTTLRVIGGGNFARTSNFIVTLVKEPEPEPEPTPVTYTISTTTGSMVNKDGGTSGTYRAKWTSTDTPQLIFTCGNVNNMTNSGTDLVGYSGAYGSSDYTITAPAGYVITSFSLDFANANHTTALEFTYDGVTYTTGTEAKHLAVNNAELPSATFTVAGDNEGVVFSNFTVTIEPFVIKAPEISTADNEKWYYIVSAATASNTEYCRDKVMYYDADANLIKFGTKTFDARYIWSFWENNGKLAIKNYRGEYFGTPGAGTGNGTRFGKSDDANYIYTIQSAFDYFTIKDTGTELHAQNDGSVIVRWAAASGNASLWRFQSVDISNAQAFLSSTNVQQGRVTTGIGNKNLPIVRSVLHVSGLEGDVTFQGVKGKVVATDLSDVTKVKAFFATDAKELFIDEDQTMTWRNENGELYGTAASVAADGTFTITGADKTLAPGRYYLWFTFDISESAAEGNTVDAQVIEYTIDGNTVAEQNGNPANAATIFLSEGSVLMPMDNGSLYYRIPAITVGQNGRLITLTDDRKAHNSDLPSHCYVVAQYSDDNGRTWTAPQTVAGTESTGGNYGHGDASIVTDRNTGNIVGIMTSAGTYGHGFFAGTAAQPPLWKTITSTDNGVTWGTPVDHTNELFGAGCSDPAHQQWLSGFSGSGAALQKRDGTLVSSFVNREPTGNVDANGNPVLSQNFYLFMSKDGGNSWYVSGTSGTTAADEPKTLERNNGDLAISVRASGYNYHNVTSDEGATWQKEPQTRFNSGITGNACDGEYMVWSSTVDGNPLDITFQTLPNSGNRQNVSIALSTDEGETFGTPKTICPAGSAYSAACVLPDGTLGVYYEENGVYGGYTMRFVRFSLDWASNHQYQIDPATFQPIQSSVSAPVRAAANVLLQKSANMNEDGDVNADGRVSIKDVADQVKMMLE